MRKIFGTDGARGIANKELTVEVAVKIGRAVASLFKNKGTILIGEDTRISSPMLRNAVSAGIASYGVNVVTAGIVPTPAISLLTFKKGFDAGVMISASHNPIEYNGIKPFDRFGFKLSDETEIEIEKLVENFDKTLPEGDRVGTVSHNNSLSDFYIEHLTSRFPLNLSKLKIAVDTAFGATYRTTPETLKKLNANLFLFGTEPDGTRINVNCGSTHMETITRFASERGADVGIAHDGDGDRVLFVDEKGKLVDGDETMLIIARYLKEKGKLKNNTVVGTVMSNMGVVRAFEESGIKFVRAPVGDRYVLREMLKYDAVIGGEQSGHIIFLEESKTGDGLITALMLLRVLTEKGVPLSKLHEGVEHYPQILENVPVKDKTIIQKESIKNFIEKEKKRLGERGRILVRPSGTEPLIRIMVEGIDPDKIREVALEIRKKIEGEM